MKARTASIKRKTKETDISVAINIDGTGKYSINTGMPFLDHMLELLSKHSLIDMKIKAKGDIEVDYHHTVEDLGLVLGEALSKALATRRGITRYGWSILPMDEALCRTAIDLGGRPWLVMDTACKKRKNKDFDLSLFRDFFQSLVTQGKMNLHISQLYGAEPHHAYECIFKSVARTLRSACSRDSRVKGIPSSKGKI